MKTKNKILVAAVVFAGLMASAAGARTFIQAWQVQDINAHSTLGIPANDGLDDILTRVDAGLASPLRMSATVPATAVLDITASMVPGADGSYHTLGQANNTIPLYPATTINYQTVGTTGGTVQVDGTTITSSLPACTTSSPGPYYRQAFVYVSSSNLVNTHFSSAATTQAGLADPGTLFATLNGVAMGYLDLQCTASGLYKTAGSSTSIIENFPTGNTLAPINNFAARVGGMAYQNPGFVAITGGAVSGAAITSSTISGNTAINLVSGSGTLTLNTTGTITVPNATDTLIGKNTTDTLTNKTLTDPVMGAYWDATEISTPASPASGVLRLYSKSGDNLYMRTSSGSEFEISNSLTNPMTTLGDTIYENSTPAPARLPGNTTSTKNFLTQTGTGSVSAAPAWGVIAAADVPVATTSANGGITIKAPTQQVFTSGTAQTYTTPAGVSWIRVRAVGGGGGGSGGGTGGGTGGGAGGSIFGSSLITAGGGGGGAYTSTPGAGGTSTLGAGAVGIALSGGDGAFGATFGGTNGVGGNGGNSAFGGGGSGLGGGVGVAGQANTGGGGGAGGSNLSTGAGGSGGGSGGFIDAIITAPAATYTYTVGAGGVAGTAGTSGFAGAAGGTGIIIVEEHYY